MVIPGNGAVELIYRVIASCGCKRAAALAPTFSEYRRAAEAKGIEFIEIPAFADDYSTVDIESILNSIKPNTLLIICNPNNPTGTLIGKECMVRLAKTLEELNCKLLIDEAFIEFTDNYPLSSMVDMVADFKNLTVIRAATKFFGMPGIRLGCAVASDSATIEGIRALLEPWNVNTAAVIAAECIYRDRDYIEKSRQWIRTERKYMYEELNSIKGFFAYPSSANFHLLKIAREGYDALKLQKELLNRGILIRLPDGFKGLTSCHFRLAVKDRRSNAALIDNLRRISK